MFKQYLVFARGGVADQDLPRVPRLNGPTFFHAPRHEPSLHSRRAPLHEWRGTGRYEHGGRLFRGFPPRDALPLRRGDGLRARGAQMHFCGARLLSSIWVSPQIEDCTKYRPTQRRRRHDVPLVTKSSILNPQSSSAVTSCAHWPDRSISASGFAVSDRARPSFGDRVVLMCSCGHVGCVYVERRWTHRVIR